MHALLALLLHRCCNFAFDDPDSSLLPDALSKSCGDALSMSCRGAGKTPEAFARSSKINPRRPRNQPSEPPKSLSRVPKSIAKSVVKGSSLLP